jgi:hypothetical protein
MWDCLVTPVATAIAPLTSREPLTQKCEWLGETVNGYAIAKQNPQPRAWLGASKQLSPRHQSPNSFFFLLWRLARNCVPFVVVLGQSVLCVVIADDYPVSFQKFLDSGVITPREILD